MKRISALICAMLIAMTMAAPACFAADAADKADTADKTKVELTVRDSSPADGQEGVAVDNLSIKVFFNMDVKPGTKEVRDSNLKQVKLTSEDGVKIPVQVFYSKDEEGLILIAADVTKASKDQIIKGNKDYTFTIGRGFQAADGTALGQAQTITVKTLNQTRSTMIYMVLMFLMMGGMVVFTVRSQKKAQEKAEEEKTKVEAVNPYKEAKKTGKTVAEIIAEEDKKKAKVSAKQAKRQAELAELEARIAEEIRRAKNKKVKKPSPISAAGSTYKVKVQKTVKPEKKNKKQVVKPKGQSKGAKKKKK